jgi:hypothetical protein
MFNTEFERRLGDGIELNTGWIIDGEKNTPRKDNKTSGNFPYTSCLGGQRGGQWVVVTVAVGVFLRSC